MSVRIAPIVSEVCHNGREYTSQEVIDYISDEDEDAFIGPDIIGLREDSQSRLKKAIEEYSLSMDQKLQKDSSEAGETISAILYGYSNRKIGLIFKSASRVQFHVFLEIAL